LTGQKAVDLGGHGLPDQEIYQHTTRDRDQAIAEALGGLVQQVRATTEDRPEEASGDA
jgi:hypothetical protein